MRIFYSNKEFGDCITHTYLVHFVPHTYTLRICRTRCSMDLRPCLLVSYIKASSHEHIKPITLCWYCIGLIYSVGLYQTDFLSKEDSVPHASVHQHTMLTDWWPEKNYISLDRTPTCWKIKYHWALPCLALPIPCSWPTCLLPHRWAGRGVSSVFTSTSAPKNPCKPHLAVKVSLKYRENYSTSPGIYHMDPEKKTIMMLLIIMS